MIPYLTAVYISADVGCLAAGWISSALMTRGWSVNAARKGTMCGLALIMTPAVIVAGTLHDPRLAIALIAIACGAHQAWSTMVFTMATDLFPSEAVASVSGLGGFVAGLVSIGAAEAVGRARSRRDALPADFVVAGLLYPVALGVFHCPARAWNRRSSPKTFLARSASAPWSALSSPSPSSRLS